MILTPCAKINVCLKVVGLREDGYHLLRMVNLPIDLHDTIEIEKNGKSETSIITEGALWGSGKETICHKALDLLREKYNFQDNFDIKIHKEIPFSAGMGGGSSDAASIILAINELLNLKMKKADMEEIALKIGADVPYFLSPKPALLEGIGEKISFIEVKNNYYCLIVKPAKGCSTKEIYQLCNDFSKTRTDVDGVLKALKEGDDKLLEKSIGNDLQAPAEALLSEIKAISQQFKRAGFNIYGMTGSGSAMFALSSQKKLCLEAEKEFLKLGYFAKTCNVLK